MVKEPVRETSRYVRRSAGLPRLEDLRAAPPDTRIVVDLTLAETRYQRHSGALPHLSDDETWHLQREDLPHPVADR